MIIRLLLALSLPLFAQAPAVVPVAPKQDVKACEKKCAQKKNGLMKGCFKQKGAASSACKKKTIDSYRACLTACEAPKAPEPGVTPEVTPGEPKQ